MKNFNHLIDNHYNNIYLPKINNGQKTNPMNLHPYMIQFYLCNPIKIFSCIIKDIDTNPDIKIHKFITPSEDRTNLESEKMPVVLLNYNELIGFINDNDFDTIVKPNLRNASQTKEQLLSSIKKDKKTWVENIPFLNEVAKNTISLRDIVSITQGTNYTRS